jgi:hypothetical protein
MFNSPFVTQITSKTNLLLSMRTILIGQSLSSTWVGGKFLQPIWWYHLLLDMCLVMCIAHDPI